VRIGEALGQARHEAGLTVTQVSEKTRIREAIIRDIERDDYSACGGDFYARGHIRAIARAAGTDSEPLIRQYDAAHRPADAFAAPGEPGRFAAPAEPRPDGFTPNGLTPGGFAPDGFAPDGFVPGGFAAPHESAPDGFAAPGRFGPGEFGPDGFAARDEFGTEAFEAPGAYEPEAFEAPGAYEPEAFEAPGAYEPEAFEAPGAYEPDEFEAPEEITSPHPVITTSQIAALDDMMASHQTTMPPGENTAPQYGGPEMPAPARRPARGSDRAAVTQPRRPARAAVANPRRPARAAVKPPRRLDWVGLLASALMLAILGGGIYLIIPGSRTSPSARPAAAGAARHGRAPHSSPAAKNSPAATPRSSPPAASPPSAPPVTLTPARAVAFGPGGPAHGDNPQNASLAIDGRPATSWQTDWYATSHFGNLQAGTGLLLDMGHPVTITTVQVLLSGATGADLQVRVGGAAALKGLRPAASAANAGGNLRLRLAKPARGRYVLIWFTRLPPDPAGTYEAKIYNVRLRGSSD
jgi:hypothetical protein